jgi:hypothetical protein
MSGARVHHVGFVAASISGSSGDPHHVCLGVDDLMRRTRGICRRRPQIGARRMPAVAFDGRKIAWITTPTAPLIELPQR